MRAWWIGPREPATILGENPHGVDSMTQLRGQVVTLFFSDIEGSTRLVHRLGEDAYGSAWPIIAGSCGA